MKKLDHLRHLVSTSYCWWFSHPKADHLEMEIKPNWYGGKTETFPLTGLGPRISEPWTINSIMPGSPMIIIKRIPSYNKILQPSPVETLKNFSKYLRNPPGNDHISHPGRDCWRRCSVSQGGIWYRSLEGKLYGKWTSWTQSHEGGWFVQMLGSNPLKKWRSFGSPSRVITPVTHFFRPFIRGP